MRQKTAKNITNILFRKQSSFIDDQSQIPSEPREPHQRYTENDANLRNAQYSKHHLIDIIASNLKRENSQIIIQQDREEMFTKMSFDKHITAISPQSIDSSSSKLSQKFINIICEEINEYEEPITISEQKNVPKMFSDQKTGERKKAV